MSAISLAGSTGGGAINGGNVTLTYPAGSNAVGNVAICTVTLGTSRAQVLAVASSSGAAYSQIVSTIQSSNVRFGVFRRIILSTGETQATITGTGGSTDATSTVIHLFAAVDKTTPEDVTATSTNGSGTTPDSPSITVASSGDAIISAIGIGLVSVPTAPSSFLNTAIGSATDTHPATSAAAWITNASTAAFNPAAWASTTATWISATIALRREYDIGAYEIGTQTDASIAVEARKVVLRSY